MTTTTTALIDMVTEQGKLNKAGDWRMRIWNEAANIFALTAIWDGLHTKKGWTVTGVNFKRKTDKILVIITAEKEGATPLVCFCSGHTFNEAMHNLRLDVRRGDLRWKEQKPWK